jgi:hypothetical protein
MMHAVSCILEPIVEALCLDAGVEHVLSLAQGMYKVGYYMNKYWKNFQVHNLKLWVLEDNELADIKNIESFDMSDITREAGTQLGMSCASRWISLLRQALRLFKRLCLEAPPDLVQETCQL